ncbi:MAG: YciI family protein [Chloroflexi bacterium]|nr:YciI family protein [Chloroflexota bacterium]
MRYMMLIAGRESEGGVDEERTTAAFGRIVEWWNGHEEAGRIVGGHQLEASSTATTVRIGPNGSATVTDGPFVEGKEVLGGHAILDVPDLDEALALAASWPAPSTIEIRPIAERA